MIKKKEIKQFIKAMISFVNGDNPKDLKVYRVNDNWESVRIYNSSSLKLIKE